MSTSCGCTCPAVPCGCPAHVLQVLPEKRPKPQPKPQPNKQAAVLPKLPNKPAKPKAPPPSDSVARVRLP